MNFNDSSVAPVWVWGLPLSPITLSETVETVAELIERGLPSFFITANTHYAMLTHEKPDLQPVNSHASFVVADGAPLVWLPGNAMSLPERVAGSDLIFGSVILPLAGVTGFSWRVVCRAWLKRLLTSSPLRYPGLQVVGTAAPEFRAMSAEDYQRLRDRIRSARPHLLIVAAGQPLGERWLSAHCDDLGVPVGVNLGASIDFAARRIQRAPRWMQKSGFEWAFRLMMEPRQAVLSLYSQCGFSPWPDLPRTGPGHARLPIALTACAHQSLSDPKRPA